MKLLSFKILIFFFFIKLNKLKKIKNFIFFLFAGGEKKIGKKKKRDYSLIT
jgi:hypothetical protein